MSGRQIDILYEDNHLLVAIKPANMPSQADASGDLDMLTYLKGYIKEKYEKPGEVYLGLVQRLDRPTAGVMVFARTSKAAARLQKQQQNGQFQKVYHAILEGVPDDRGTLTDYLLKGRDNNVRVVPPDTPGAKQAILRYRLLEHSHGRSWVEIELITGRSHQIRVQFASRGMPLLGDARYGTGGQNLVLYAHKVRLFHPTKKDPMEFLSDEHIPRFQKLMKG